MPGDRQMMLGRSAAISTSTPRRQIGPDPALSLKVGAANLAPPQGFRATNNSGTGSPPIPPPARSQPGSHDRNRAPNDLPHFRGTADRAVFAWGSLHFGFSASRRFTARRQDPVDDVSS